MQASLFHALGVSWPEHVLVIFGPSPRLEEQLLQSANEQDVRERASRVFALLRDLFEAEMKRGQLEVSQHQQWASERGSK